MTGEPESAYSPVVLKLSKEVWLRAKARKTSELEKSGGVVGHGCKGSGCRECLRVLKDRSKVSASLRRRPFDKDESSESVIAYFAALLSRLPFKTRQSSVRIDAKEDMGNAIGSLTYSDLVGHVTSMRLEHVPRLLRPIVQKLMAHPRNNDIFNTPVDPIALNLHDYEQRVRVPMDLGTVKSRLEEGAYSSLADCAHDMTLVFENAIRYNPEGNPVHMLARALLDELETDLRLAYEKHERELERKKEHSCSVCSGETCFLCGDMCLRFESPVLVCHGSCGQRIKKQSVFFVSADASDVYCQRCYCNLPVVLSSPEQSKAKLKKDLLRRKVEEEVWEPWINCDSCGRWVHKVCALLNDRADSSFSALNFSCPLCHLEDAVKIADAHTSEEGDVGSCATDCPSDSDEGATSPGATAVPATAPLKQNKEHERELGQQWSAKSLPRTRLSDFMEQMLCDRLRAQGFPDLMRDGSGSLTVRVTSNENHTLHMPSALVNNMVNMDGSLLPASLPYRQKSVLLFQRLDGVDVCLFSLYVQEFDATCPEPNRNRVYVSYLDSVEYLCPGEARTLVYHELMVAYLQWVQARGFEHAHIWACPPQRGDNFIFWSHPSSQRTPSRERLNNWYLLMLQRCERMGIVGDVSTLWAAHFAQQSRRFLARPKGVETTSASTACAGVTESSLEQPICPPVFEGDFWVMECLRLHRQASNRVGMECEGAVDKMCGNIRAARDMLRDLQAADTFHYFSMPVDPILLDLPMYAEVVRWPMDLGTVRSRLRQNEYPSFLDFARDVRLTLDNAMLFNPSGHPVHYAAATLLQMFQTRVSAFVKDRALDTSDEALDVFLAACSLKPQQETQLAAPTLSRTASCTSVGSPSHASDKRAEEEEGEDEPWVRRLFSASAFSTEGNVRTCTGKSELGARGTSLLMSDLCKSVLRLKDDLFVVALSRPGATKKRALEEEEEHMHGVVPVVRAGKQRKVPHHLRAGKAPKKAPAFYSVRAGDDCLSTEARALLSALEPNTNDPDELCGNPLVNSRHTFLELCQFRHYQFDTLRRAKHSSLQLLFHLHKGADPKYAHLLRPHCAGCKQPICDLRWHCDQCVEVDLCDSCSRSFAHPHQLTPFRVTYQ